MNQLNVSTFDVATRQWLTNSWQNANIYFGYGEIWNSTWRDITGYIVGCNTDADKMPNGQNVSWQAGGQHQSMMKTDTMDGHLLNLSNRRFYMKTVWAIIVAFIIVALGVALKISGTDVNDNVATPDNNVESPSGRYVLRVVEQYADSVRSWSFIVSENIDGKVGRDIFVSKDSFRVRDRLIIMWDDEDRVWVYSGDVGTFYWNEQGGEWKKNDKIDITIPSEVRNNIG